MGGGKFNGQPRKNIADIDILRIFAHRFISSEEINEKNASETVLNFYKKVFPRLDVSCFCVCFGLAKKLIPNRHTVKSQTVFQTLYNFFNMRALAWSITELSKDAK